MLPAQRPASPEMAESPTLTTHGVPTPGPSAAAAGTDRAVNSEAGGERQRAPPCREGAQHGAPQRGGSRSPPRKRGTGRRRWTVARTLPTLSDRADGRQPGGSRLPSGTTPEYLGHRVRVLSRIVRHGSASAVLVALLLGRAGASRTSGNLNTYITGLPGAERGHQRRRDRPAFQVVSTCKGMGLQAYISRTDIRSTVTARSSAATSRTSSRCRRRSFGSGIYEGTPQGTWLQQAGPVLLAGARRSPSARATRRSRGPRSRSSSRSSADDDSSGTTDVTQQENGELLTIAQARAAIAPRGPEGQAEVGARAEAHVHAPQLGQHPRGRLLRVLDRQQEVPLQRPVADGAQRRRHDLRDVQRPSRAVSCVKKRQAQAHVREGVLQEAHLHGDRRLGGGLAQIERIIPPSTARATPVM